MIISPFKNNIFTSRAGGVFSIANSFLLDGTDEYFNSNDLISNVSSDTVGTFSILVRPISTTPAGNQMLVSLGDTDADTYFFIRQTTSGEVQSIFRVAGTTFFNIRSTSAVFTGGTWSHIMAIHNGTRLTFYVDNVAVAMTDIITTDLTKWIANLTGCDNSRIGSLDFNSGGNTAFFNGYVSQISYMNIALDASQRTALYNAGKPANAQSLFGSNCKWFFNPDNSGSTAQFTVTDSVNSVDAVSVNLEDADKTTVTPY